jgi:translation initiation factor 2B subunit (eIF-2B alpha/beta/delta family)
MPTDNSRAIPALDVAIAAIIADHEHGASYLARQAALALAAASAPGAAAQLDAASHLAMLHAAARRLATARPSMAALANTAALIWLAAAQAGERGAREDDQLAALHEEAARLGALWGAAAHAIGQAAIPLLKGTLYTISRSGTVEAVLTRLAHECAAADLPRKIIVAHSLPGGEGIAAAEALAAVGWHATLVADAACGLFVPEAAAVVCGADSVRADGSVVNKVGTLPLALAARAAVVPVYVLCETLKIAAPDFPLALEELAPLDLAQSAPLSPSIATRNPAFDRTPGEYITAVVTERGILTPALLAAESQRAAGALTALDASD